MKNRKKGKYIDGFAAVLNNGEVIEVKGQIKSANSIEIKASNVKRLRYAYANFPVCPLYNSAGLPALPFDVEVNDNQ